MATRLAKRRKAFLDAQEKEERLEEKENNAQRAKRSQRSSVQPKQEIMENERSFKRQKAARKSRQQSSDSDCEIVGDTPAPAQGRGGYATTEERASRAGPGEASEEDTGIDERSAEISLSGASRPRFGMLELDVRMRRFVEVANVCFPRSSCQFPHDVWYS